MKLIIVNKYLSLFQFVGFILTFILISTYCINEGKMMIFYIPIIGILFTPFIIVSYNGINYDKISKTKISNRINIALVFLVLPSLTLPSFYEEGGFIILALVIFIVALIVWLRKYIEKQLFVFNLIGISLLFLIIVEYLIEV